MAISENELRVGNIVKKGEDWFVADHLTIACSVNYEPIPLTPAILKEFGFSYLKVEGVASLDEYNPVREENTHNWTLTIKREGIYDGEGRLELVKWGDSPKEKTWFSNQWLRVEMKYLHQLQNLFFALSGKELDKK